jgi:bifunctional enzyme CysN/CysC
LPIRKSKNITRVEHRITTEQREERNRHRGAVLWFTGLSGAGKSTLAFLLEEELFKRGYQVYVLDGDNVRDGLNSDLGFSPADRTENIRRVGEVAALFADAGIICISAFISPYRADRDAARNAAGAKFHEVYVKADLATCEQRDPKGLYKKARAGQIAEFTGLTAPYEQPLAAELVVDTQADDIRASLETLCRYIDTHLET